MKRFLDLTFGILALIGLSPLIAAVSLIILILDGRPVLFIQDRVGMNNELFSVMKFRTMKNGTPNVAKKELDDPERFTTVFGRLLRKTSLDELPQLINIIRGDMSFVGPRPLIPEEDVIRKLRAKYGVYGVRPGVTGWAQVMGRDSIGDEEKAAYDKEYVERRSLWFDIQILLKTVGVVLTKENMADF
ncbi:MAG: sugar transferase [Oscillospiraceae bacterium]|nr:sugar transferase [Oscillospiraceae bacterium]